MTETPTPEAPRKSKRVYKPLPREQIEAMTQGRKEAAERRRQGLPPLPRKKYKRKGTADGATTTAPPTVPAPPPEAEAGTEAAPDTEQHLTEMPQEEVPEFASRRPKNLMDIMSLYRFQGQYYVEVNRKKPTHFEGRQIAGVQDVKLWRPTDDEGFREIFGGGEYELRVYGPPTRGEPENPDGTIRYQPYTDPIKYTVSGPANPDPEIPEEEERVVQPIARDNRERRPIRQPPAVEADLRRIEVSHEEEMDDRRYRRQQELLAREEQRLRDESREKADTARMLDARHEAEMKRLAEIRERELELVRQAEAARAGIGPKEILELMQAGKPSDREVQQLIERHQAEMQRQTQAHTHALNLERERYDKLLKDRENAMATQIRNAEERADRRVSDVEQRLERQTAEAERLRQHDVAEERRIAADRIRDMEERNRDRIADIERNHLNVIQGMERSHAAEIRSHEHTSSISMTSTDASWRVQIEAARAENQRLQAECDRLRTEVEKSKDWLTRMKEVQEQAEVLGMVRADEAGGDAPADWKQTAVAALAGAFDKAPAIAASLAEAVKARAGVLPQTVTQQQSGARREMVARATAAGVPGYMPTGAPLPFASEDGPSFMPPVQPMMSPAAIPPTAVMVPAAPVMPPIPPYVPPQETTLSPSVPPPGAVPVSTPAPATAPAAPLEPAPNPVVQHPQAAAGDPMQQQMDTLIAALGDAYTNQAPAHLVAGQLHQQLVQLFGPINASLAIKQFEFEKMHGYLQQSAVPAAQVLLRRDGEKYLRDVLTFLQQKA